jgi:hypothetical protein
LLLFTDATLVYGACDPSKIAEVPKLIVLPTTVPTTAVPRLLAEVSSYVMTTLLFPTAAAETHEEPTLFVFVVPKEIVLPERVPIVAARPVDPLNATTTLSLPVLAIELCDATGPKGNAAGVVAISSPFSKNCVLVTVLLADPVGLYPIYLGIFISFLYTVNVPVVSKRWNT